MRQLNFVRSMRLGLYGAHVRTWLVYATALLAATTVYDCASAQDPFGADDGGAKGAAKGDAVQKSTKAKGSKADVVNDDEKAIEPELILQIRENNPTTALQLVEAARLTLDFGRPDEAKKYLAKAIALKLEEPQLVELARKFGPDFFIRLSAAKVVKPEGLKLGEAVLSAYGKIAKDPERQKKLIAELGMGSPEAQRAARNHLAEAGLDVVPLLVASLDEPTSEAVAVQLQQTLLQMGPEIPGALTTVLMDGSSVQQIRALEVLGQKRATSALLPMSLLTVGEATSAEVRKVAQANLLKLMPQLPTQSDVEGTALRRAKGLLSGEQRLAEDASGMVSIWIWDDASKTVRLTKQSQRDAALLSARDLTEELTQLAPQNPSYAVLAKVAALEAEGVMEATEGTKPAKVAGDVSPSDVSAVNVAQLNQSLDWALKNGHAVAAQKLATQLGNAGDDSVLLGTGAVETPLARAMVHRNIRVRLAAAFAALKLSQGNSFVGSSRVAEVLGFVAGSNGVKKVLICEARKTAASNLSAIMGGQGFESEVVFNGREALQKVSQQPDIACVLIDDACESPRAAELVQLLRRDFHSAALPIAVLVRDENAQRLEFRTHDDLLTIVVPRIYDESAAALQTAKLVELAGRNWVTEEERLVHAKDALGALATLVKNDKSVLAHEVYRQEAAIINALDTPTLTVAAAEVLALMGTPGAQTALVEYIGVIAHPLEMRQQVANRFADAVKLRGTLLTQKQILEQYDRYNASETLDEGTQKVLGDVIDTLESRAMPVGGLTVGAVRDDSSLVAPTEAETEAVATEN